MSNHLDIRKIRRLLIPYFIFIMLWLLIRFQIDNHFVDRETERMVFYENYNIFQIMDISKVIWFLFMAPLFVLFIAHKLGYEKAQVLLILFLVVLMGLVFAFNLLG